MTSPEIKNTFSVERYTGPIIIREKEKSLTLPFPRWLFITSPHQIARHERFIEDKLSKINMKKGWKGNPLAVTSFSERLLLATKEPGTYLLDGLQYGELGILDGHHRHEVAIRNNSLVVAQLFPVDAPQLIIETWDGTGTPLTKDDVKTVLLDPELYLPPRSTRFRIIEEDGGSDGLPAFQPHVTLPYHLLSEENVSFDTM
jgi:hypothetical protein